MYTNRMSYVIFYQGKHVLEKLKTLPIDISYVSQKQNYVVVYGDEQTTKNLKKQLKDVKGFKHLGPSYAFDENLNF